MVVAKVGKNTLYRSDVTGLIPVGTSSEDSLRLSMQYINSWATDMVFLEIAEEQLSKNAKDVSAELESYRRSLLKYRYEQLYINERLDTTLTESEVEEYYKGHSKDFILERPLLKVRFVKLLPDSPHLAEMKELISSDDFDGFSEIEHSAYSSVNKFTSYSDRWIDLAELAKDMDVDYALLKPLKVGGFLEIKDDYNGMNVAYILDLVEKGSVAPVEYCRESISDKIISVRKHRLTLSLEHEMLEDARNKGKFVIY